MRRDRRLGHEGERSGVRSFGIPRPSILGVLHRPTEHCSARDDQRDLRSRVRRGCPRTNYLRYAPNTACVACSGSTKQVAVAAKGSIHAPMLTRVLIVKTSRVPMRPSTARLLLATRSTWKLTPAPNHRPYRARLSRQDLRVARGPRRRMGPYRPHQPRRPEWVAVGRSPA